MNKQEILQHIDKKYLQKEAPAFRVGDTVRVHVRITEGDTTRVQAFEGIVISMKGHGGGSTFTVRKISFGVGVERVFPMVSPNLEKIEVLRSGHVRRAKLYYLRDRVGRSARLDEKEAAAQDAKKADGKVAAAPQQELVGAKDK